MRQVCARPTLDGVLIRRLAAHGEAIANSVDPRAEAERRYAAQRRLAWFRMVSATLAALSGVGHRCMYCGGSESSQVEHFRPKASYPSLAFSWENLLWVCGGCNQFKGDRFDEEARPINPIDDLVWNHFFIDEFGNLCARWDPVAADLDARALRTIELLNLDRQPLQESRFARLIDLRKKIADANALFGQGLLTELDLQTRLLEWFEQPFQPDVADYFFDGPGRSDAPFNQFFELAGL
jgi:uncharacterized protein (TIGR02646 family)